MKSALNIFQIYLKYFFLSKYPIYSSFLIKLRCIKTCFNGRIEIFVFLRECR